MKVAIFNGSPRNKGNTATMTSYLAEQMKARGADTEEHFLYDSDIKGCKNCGICHASTELNGCAIKDDALPLLDKFLSAELVVFASPIYMWHLTASLNAFMERLHSLCRHDPPAVNKMAGKKISIAMTMGDDEYVAADVVNSLLHFCEYFELDYKGAFAVPFANKEQISRQLYQEKMEDFVKRIMN